MKPRNKECVSAYLGALMQRRCQDLQNLFWQPPWVALLGHDQTLSHVAQKKITLQVYQEIELKCI